MTFSQIVPPLLYFVTFGMGLRSMMNMDERPHLHYSIPGFPIMTTIRNSYTSVPTRISVMHPHEKSLECCFYSPMRMYPLVTGYILAGVSRGMYSGVFILLLGLVSRAGLVYNGWPLVAVVLNVWIFSALGSLAAMAIRSHYDVNNFTDVVITPMSSLCGTFFLLEGVPQALKRLMNVMPLTHTTRLIRGFPLGGSVNWTSMAVSTLFAAVPTGCCVWICYREVEWLRPRSDLGRLIDTVLSFSYSNLRAY